MDHRSLRIAERNPHWKGDLADPDTIHNYVRAHWYGPIPTECSECGKVCRLDLRNVSATYNPTTYTRDPANWIWSCRRCHMISDGRMERLQELLRENRKYGHKFQKGHIPWNKRNV